MNVAAVDISASTEYQDRLYEYKQNVFRVLNNIKPPVFVIRWNHNAEIKKYTKIGPEVIEFHGHGGTDPMAFLKELVEFTDPINLYVFTDGEIPKEIAGKCKKFIKEQQFSINFVKLYYIGEKSGMNLKFVDVFESIPLEICINQKNIGRVEPQLNVDGIDYDYIMKDDSLKATVISKLSSNDIDPAKLKKQICDLSTRILKEYFKDRISIKNFYDSDNVDDCVAYVKQKSYFQTKADFQRKISDILKLFDKEVNIYSMNVFEDAKEASPLSYQEPELECRYLTCDILYEKCKTGCIPIKECSDDVWFDKDIFQNPFMILESEQLVKRIVDLVEPYVMDYGAAYKRIRNPNISPFTRDTLKGVYVLHNDTIKVHDLIKHNNFVLSTFFKNKLPGKSVLWHMIFLYILATEKFPKLRECLFEEIRFLGNHSEYFVSLNPSLNPPIVEKLNVCFWYIARICYKAFPNSKKNILRSSKFNIDVFLKFYKDVYDPCYEAPEELPLWKLWKTLCLDKHSIFPILAHFYHSEKLDVEDPPNEFHYILYRQIIPSENQLQHLSKFNFLKQLDLATVLSVYNKIIESKCPSPYDEINVELENADLLIDINEPEDKLDHVKINIKTCHPLVLCPVTKKHWRECIGEYDVMRESCLRLFRKYCIKYQKYPKSSAHLFMFINEYIFNRQNYIPQLFSLSMKNSLDKIMNIFKDVMETYSCTEYLNRANKYCSEEVRMQYEFSK